MRTIDGRWKSGELLRLASSNRELSENRRYENALDQAFVGQRPAAGNLELHGMRYHILLHGRGLRLLDGRGERKTGGVYVWRTVHASDRTSAVLAASRDVLLDPHFLEDVLNENLDEIAFEGEEVICGAVEAGDGDSGYIFYVDDDA